MASPHTDPTAGRDTATTPEVDGNWFKALRSDESRDLLREDPRAFLVLFLIASRARWQSLDVNRHGLEIGEAVIGDHAAVGMTRQQHREALERLVRYGHVKISRTTNKGTVAKLCSSVVFAPLRPESNHPATTQQPPSNHPATTNKKGRRGEETPRPAGTPTGERLAELPFDSEAFRTAWTAWTEHRRQKRDPLTPIAARLQLAALGKLTEVEAIRDLEHATMNNWTGLHPRQPSTAPARPAPAAGDSAKTPSLLKDLWK